MSRCEKLLAKARNNPQGLRFRELERLAECYGFTFSRSKGSHRTYKHRERGVSIPLHPIRTGGPNRIR
ncbi:MAG: type II toxin-antitoxin system HicA family toxin [Chloroflexota bacterium]|nr:type II toxin-antitoxin system HicA family toxin [Chloroflexota bacterium]